MLSEVLRRLNEGEEARAISFTSYDKQRSRAGRWIKIEHAFITTPREKQKRSGGSGVKEGAKYQPDHKGNHTINVGVRGTYNIRKIKTHLITEFNGHRVIW